MKVNSKAKKGNVVPLGKSPKEDETLRRLAVETLEEMAETIDRLHGLLDMLIRVKTTTWDSPDMDSIGNTFYTLEGLAHEIKGHKDDFFIAYDKVLGLEQKGA